MSRSGAWKHFERESADMAKCIECNSVIKTKGGSTSGLIRHLRDRHSINVVSSSSTDKTQTQAGKRSELSFKSQSQLPFKKMKRYDLNETVARLAAENGFSINGIAKCDYLRHAMAKDDMKLPACPGQVKDLIIDYHKEVNANLTQTIKSKIKNGERFSITTDEWTNISGRRFFNVNVHGYDGFVANLGLVRIEGSFTAERAVQCIEQHLNLFGIDFSKHCVASTADGASVMKKIGRLLLAEFHCCYAHALHLAVSDVFYKSKKIENVEAEPILAENEVVQDSDNNDSDIEEETGDVDDIQVLREDSPELVLHNDIEGALKNVRKDVKRFRKSPKDNEILQLHVKGEFKTELKLLLDVRTRWSSIHTMVSRYCQLRHCLEKTFIDLKTKSAVSEEDFQLISSINLSLEPLKLTTNAICRNDATLLSADAALECLLSSLKDKSDKLSDDLYESLATRITERRNTQLNNLMKYLQNKEIVGKDDFFH